MITRGIYFSYENSPVAGLTPTWTTLKKLSDGTDVTPQPTITEIGGGFYKFDALVPTGEQWCGVIDGGIANLDGRNLPWVMGCNDNPLAETEIVITPVYDEVSGTMQFMVFAIVAGQISQLSEEVTLNFYDTTHTELFELNSTSPVGGVFVLSKANPVLNAMEGYYCKATLTIEGVDFASAETVVALN